MKNKYFIISCAFFIILFIHSPVLSSGLEDISLFKIILQLIFYIAIFIAVIFLSIYGTRFIANNYRKTISSKYTELLDVLNVPGGSKIVIIKVSNKIYLLSHSNNGGVTVIDAMDEDEFFNTENSFENHLNRYGYTNRDDSNLNAKFSSIINKFNLQKNKDVNHDEEDN